MITGKWIVYDHHIAFDTGDEVLHPDADEVYSFIEKDGCDTSELPSPINQLEKLRFSRIGSPVKCNVYSDDDGKIHIYLFASRKGNEIPVDMIDGQIINQCVTDGEWFYINNDYTFLSQLFAAAGIKSTGEISIGQYLSLIKQELYSDHQEIINDVDNEIVSRFLSMPCPLPKGMIAKLYRYQEDGFYWMHNMLLTSPGCILGDEMGLGKTLQIITIFQDFKEHNQSPSLVVAPVSLLENWKRECKKFAPNLDVFIHHGPKRTGRAVELKKHDVIVVSYNTAVSDLAMLKMITWKCVVLDEAQNIKNPESERAKSVKAISREKGIAVTGTPFENHITDIWSLVDFSVPGLLGTLGVFKQNISDDVLGAEKIEPILSPIMIRRLVKEVANDLPEKVVVTQPLIMSENERNEYEKYRQEAAASSNSGNAVTLAILQKLRMYCTHRSLVNNEAATDPAFESIKYQRFCELVEEITERREKVIVFTSYKRMFDIFKQDVPARFGIEIKCINGDTPVDERQKIVDWFNAYEGPAMLALNPRAAGTGLNITGANHVIHFNLEWNPSLEDQASARAYRRGQEKTVFIYRLYYADTVEDVVNDRIERKRIISSAAVVGTDGSEEKNDILRALELSPAFQGKGI